MVKMKTPNILLSENDTFGKPSYDIVRLFLSMVDMNMMAALDLPAFSTQRCQVFYMEDGPMCSKVGEEHIIFLSVKDNHWCQWVYQFAHEYCHHLINGTLSGEWSDLMWFEETICELSSLYNMNKMIGFCVTNGLQVYAPSVEGYLNNLLSKNKDTYCLSVDGGWYRQFEDSLKVKQYQRDLYNAIAVMMYPLFMENPRLWKMILNIGDIRSWTSLEDLFSHLEATADDSYRDSLSRLRRLFS